MSMLLKARKFATSAPGEALLDTLGFGVICALIFIGFSAPSFL